MRANEKRERESLSSLWSVVPLWELVGTIRMCPNGMDVPLCLMGRTRRP